MAATAYLYQALPEDMILQVASCNSAKEIWEALQTRHIAKLNNIVTKASGLGSTFDQQTLVRKLLSSVPKRFIQIVAAIEQFTDLEETTLDETIGRLKTFEERINLFNGNPSDNQDKLLFANHDNSSNHDKGFRNSGQEKFRSSQDNKHDGKSKQFNNDRKPSHKFKKNNFQKGTKDSSKVKCYNCNKFGHVRRNCKQKDRGQEQSNLVQEDVEPTLLMAVQGKVDKGEEIFLNEKEIKPKKYISTDESLWYLDNGASNHMTGIRTHFKEIDRKISGRIRFGDGSYVEIKGRGSILLECKNKEQRVIPNVYYIPNLKSNILSLGQLTENGCKIIMQNNILLLYGQDQKLLMRVERSRNRLYKINLKIGMPMCLLANLENPAWLWHARLGHLNFDSLKQMTQKKLVEGIPSINHKSQVCNACLLGKHYRAPFPNQTNTKSFEPLNLVFGDLCGPIFPETKSGKKYMFLLVDNCTRTDRGGEFTSREFTRYCKENGILRQLTAPYSPQQNGIVERRNRTKAYRVLGSCTPKEIVVSRDVKFKEDEGWDWKGYLDNPNPNEPEWRDFIISENHTSSSRIIDEINTQDSERNRKIVHQVHCITPEVQSDELLLLEEEPRNYKEAAQDKKWIKAMQIEIDSINKNKTWKLTTLPDIQKAIWSEMDYDEVFAPVARMETVRLILALSAYHGWEVHHLDVKSAFLHGELKEELRVHDDRSSLKTLKSLGFKKCTLEQAIYTRISKDSMLLVGVYVDDLIVTGSNVEDLQTFKSQMEENYGINIEKGKGTTGIIFYLGNSPISWSSQKQPTVALSSCESEFMAATTTACQALWLQRLLNALTNWKEEKVTIRVSTTNRQLTLLKNPNPVFHGRSKHIDIRYHFIRECVEKNQIKVKHISGDLQKADILTKALARIKFAEMRELLGVKNLKEQERD
ncbi:zinc finger, CCHC-type containing protein [Tanacetum coccineum]